MNRGDQDRQNPDTLQENDYQPNNQADNLMKLFQEVANHTPEEEHIDELDEEQDEYKAEYLKDSYVELDLLNLPPRREVHGERKNRYSFSLMNPITRLLLVMLVVIVTIIILIYFDLTGELFSLGKIDHLEHIIKIDNSMRNQKMI